MDLGSKKLVFRDLENRKPHTHDEGGNQAIFDERKKVSQSKQGAFLDTLKKVAVSTRVSSNWNSQTFISKLKKLNRTEVNIFFHNH